MRTGSGEAGLEALGQCRAVEVFADEDEGVLARGRAPRGVKLGVEEHMHALENEAVGGALDREHAFAAVDVAALHFEEFADPGVELFAVEVAGGGDADAAHLVVVTVGVGVVLLPAGLGGVAHDVDVQRMVSAGLEDDEVTGRSDGETKVGVGVLADLQALEGAAGGDGVAGGDLVFPVGEDEDGSLRR